MASWTIPPYFAPGSYKIMIVGCSAVNCTVDNTVSSATELAKDYSDSSFSISSATTAVSNSMKVISPNGGEVWQVGQTYPIKWTATGYSADALMQISLWDMRYSFDTVIAKSANTGSYNFTVPSSLGSTSGGSLGGNNIYKIRAQAYSTALQEGVTTDASDLPFSIVTGTTTTPSIAVLYPNGGEVFKVGDTIQIKWKSQGSADKAGIYISDSRIYGSGSTNYISFPSMDSLSVPVGQGYYNWKVPSLSVLPGTGDGKNYKISVSINSNVYDASDAPFSILPIGSAVPAIPAVPTAVSGTSTVSAIPATPAYASLQEGSLIKMPGSPNVYVIQNGQKVRIQSPQEFEQKGYKWDQIKEVQAELLAQIAELKTQIKQLKEELKRAGTLIKNINGPEVYVVTENGAKEHIKSAEEFAKKGYKWNQIQEVSSEELAQIPDTGSLSSSSDPVTVQSAAVLNLKPGLLVKSPDSPTIYYITKTGVKKPILNPEVFNSYKENKWENVKVIPQEQIAQYPEIMTLKLPDDSKIYFVKNGKKQWVKTPTAFEKMKLQWDKVEVVNKTELNAYQEDEVIE